MLQNIGRFDNYPVKFDPDTEEASCKGVIFTLDQAIAASKGACSLGTAKHVEHYNGLVKIDCLTDTIDNLKLLIKNAKNAKKGKRS